MKFCGLIVIASHAADVAILHEFTLYKHNKQMLGNCNKTNTETNTNTLPKSKKKIGISVWTGADTMRI